MNQINLKKNSCISKSDSRKFYVNQKWNNDECRCECKNPIKYHFSKIRLFLESQCKCP